MDSGGAVAGTCGGQCGSTGGSRASRRSTRGNQGSSGAGHKAISLAWAPGQLASTRCPCVLTQTVSRKPTLKGWSAACKVGGVVPSRVQAKR
ncbi:hypothetical protein D3C76_923060 [compost metagenome]